MKILRLKYSKKIKYELIRNIVRFSAFRDTSGRPGCVILRGNKAVVDTYVLEGTQRKVLAEMVIKYWAIEDSIKFN